MVDNRDEIYSKSLRGEEELIFLMLDQQDG